MKNERVFREKSKKLKMSYIIPVSFALQFEPLTRLHPHEKRVADSSDFRFSYE